MSVTTIVLRRSNRSAKAPASGPSTIAGSSRNSSTPPSAKLAAGEAVDQRRRGRGDREQAEPVAEARQRHRQPQLAEVAHPQDRAQLGDQAHRARHVGVRRDLVAGRARRRAVSPPAPRRPAAPACRPTAGRPPAAAVRSTGGASAASSGGGAGGVGSDGIGAPGVGRRERSRPRRAHGTGRQLTIPAVSAPDGRAPACAASARPELGSGD